MKDIGFEDTTLSLMTLHPTPMDKKSHKDEMNSKLYCFSKTVTLNIVLEDSKENMYLLQVIANFRKVIEHYSIPCGNLVIRIKSHVEEYFQELKKTYYNLFSDQEMAGSTCLPMDRTKFWIDDNLTRLTIKSNCFFT